MEEAGSGIQFQPLSGALKRGQGPSVRPEAHPLPRDPPGGKIPVLGQKLGLSKKFAWGRKDLT